MLDHTHQLSSSWTYFSDECDCLKKFFSRLKYPKCLIKSTINNFVHSRVADQHSSQVLKEQRAIVRVFTPIKDQESANYVKKQLKDLSLQVQTTVQPVFVSCKINQHLKVKRKSHRLQTNNVLFIVFNVTCVMQVMWAIRTYTYMYMWLDINNDHLLYINSTKTNMAWSLKTY